MAIVTDLLDELQRKRSDRAPWEQHWLDIARYVLPDAERFDRMFASNEKLPAAINSVVSEPVAARRGRDLYDMTSLWAVERGAAGTLALVTPQTGTWHDLTTDDPFGGEPSDEERRFYEALRNYLFTVRSNPRSGFWAAHKASLRCMWGFGTSVIFIGDAVSRGVKAPISYAYVPISENHLGTNFEGVVDTNYRLFTRSARQCVERWGTACSAKTQAMASDPKKRDQLVTILHAVAPRAEAGTYGNTVRNSPFMSCYVEIEEKKLIGESGFFEFPFRVDHWQRNTTQPYAEGPVAVAIADIKSLNIMAKAELTSTQQAVSPPIATPPETLGQRLDLNPRAVNPGFVNARGQLLAQPILTARPDFAQAVLEVRRQQLRTTLYIDLWTTIIDSQREQTAYEVSIKNQERADMIGPVGTSLQAGLSFQIDREIGILNRLGAFMPGSPLEAPESLQGRDIGTRFTSPLDRARKLGELQGVQQLFIFAQALADAGSPEVMDKLDADESLEFAQEVLGAPRKIMVTEDVLAARRQARAEAAQKQGALQDAAQSGMAAQEAAAGAEALAASPAAQEVLKRIGGVA